MSADLPGRHALVGGASQGIGRAVALELAGRGASVTVLGRDPARLHRVRAELQERRPDADHAALAVDYADRPGLERAVAARIAERPVTILINNAGGPPPGPLHQAEEAAFQAALGEHLYCNHLLLKLCLPAMIAAQFGRVVNIISTSVKEPLRGLGVSNTARWAVAAWAKTLATELAPAGVTVNNVLPGYTETERLRGLIAHRAAETGQSAEAVAMAMRASVPAGRFARPEEIAAAVGFLCSPAAAYVNGINLPVDGGRTASL